MATTKDRLEQLTNVERELHDQDVVALEDIWGADAEGPPTAAGHGPAVTVPRSSLRSRLLEPITGRWAAIGAIAWVLLVGIGIAVEPSPAFGCDGAGVWRPRWWRPASWWPPPSPVQRPATTPRLAPGGSSSWAVGWGWWRPASLDCGGTEPRYAPRSTGGSATVTSGRCWVRQPSQALLCVPSGVVQGSDALSHRCASPS
jgi:hypothetical protein